MSTFDESNRARQETVEEPADAACGPVLLLAAGGSAASWHAAGWAGVLAGLLRATLVVLHAVDVHGAFRGGIHFPGLAGRGLDARGALTEAISRLRPGWPLDGESKAR